jgi:GT2 family glycosyltransferase
MVERIGQIIKVIRYEGFAGLFTRIKYRLQARVIGSKRSPEYEDLGTEDPEYLDWITRNEPGQAELEVQRVEQLKFGYRPLISIVTPVYNPDVAALRRTIESVIDQTYPNWELCIVDGASSQKDVVDVIESFAVLDERIRFHRLDQNLGIAGNTNVALGMATGAFVAFLDHDDLLSPFAFFEVVRKINANPALDLIYSDHDLVSEDGTRRFQPLFKPDWSPEIMLSANYITHLTVVRRELLMEVGCFDSDMDGAQDWDLFLRVTEKTDRIAHIPKILYHWRESSVSTATNIHSKPYAMPAQLKAIKNHLSRQGLEDVEVFFDRSGFIRVRWALIRRRKVSIIIPSKGANQILESCIDSILSKTRYVPYEIIIVNNGKRPPEDFRYFRRITSIENIKAVHYSGEFNYSKANNFGAGFAGGELLLFLNNDTQVIDPDWLGELTMWASREAIGAVGGKLLTPDGRIQHAGVIIGLTGYAGHIFAGRQENRWSRFGLAEWYRNYSAVTAACVMIRKDVFEMIGGFSEEFILCGSDVELCLRLWSRGLRVVYNPFARLMHLEGATRAGEIPAQDFEASYRCYLPLLENGDPFYNPNLSYWHFNPALTKQGELPPLAFVNQHLESLREKAVLVSD